MHKKLVTIFNDFESIHLSKDVGMIPQYFSTLESYRKSIIYSWDREGGGKIVDYDNVTVIPIKSKFRSVYYIKLIVKIINDDVTVINLYHNSLQTALLIRIFKLLNLRTYVKLDMDAGGLSLIKKQYKSKQIASKFKMKALNKSDILSVEDSSIYKELLCNNIFDEHRLNLLPNAIDGSSLSNLPTLSSDRENTIVVVGRIGVYPKNHELILDSLSRKSLPSDWHIKFVGPIDDSFQLMINDFYARNESLASRVHFLGARNREDLFNILSSSKVFLMSSISEGFSLAMVEAAFMGCYIISTHVGGVIDITNNGELGTIYEDSDIDTVIKSLDKFDFNMNFSKRIEYIRGTFELRHILTDFVERNGL